jgi:hypothetical protein
MQFWIKFNTQTFDYKLGRVIKYEVVRIIDKKKIEYISYKIIERSNKYYHTIVFEETEFWQEIKNGLIFKKKI